jgi:hypothetical protein
MLVDKLLSQWSGITLRKEGYESLYIIILIECID